MTSAQRLHARAVMEMMYAHRGQFDYPPGDQRTNRDAHSWALTEGEMERYLKAGGRPMMDCSEYAPWCLKCAGAWPFTSPGATSSHLAIWTARRWPIYTDARGAAIGALVIFGPGGGHHEAIVKEPDPKHGNPLLSSHGHAGLDELELETLAASQAAEGFRGVRLLSVVPL